WCRTETGNALPYVFAHPFRSDGFLNRRQLEAKFEADIALPDPRLLLRPDKYRIGVLCETDTETVRAFIHLLEVGYLGKSVEHRTYSHAGEELLEWVSRLHVCFFFDSTNIAALGLSGPELAVALNSHGVCTVFVDDLSAAAS